MIRRMIYSFTVIVFPNLSFLQFFVIMYSNLGYISYLLLTKPFMDPQQMDLEVLNEISIQIFTYFYMFFKQSLAPNSTIGWAYIIAYLLTFLINVNAILNNMIYKTIP